MTVGRVMMPNQTFPVMSGERVKPLGRLEGLGTTDTVPNVPRPPNLRPPQAGSLIQPAVQQMDITGDDYQRRRNRQQR